jgi:PLP dependent protein
MIKENYLRIQERVSDACARSGRMPSEIKIVAAAKGQGLIKIEEAVECGVKIIGHNYIQEAYQETSDLIRKHAEIHMIGHVQKNKAGKAAEIFDVIETVDDEELAAALSRRASAIQKKIRVLVQVNLGGEIQKSGVEENRASQLAEAIKDLPWLKLEGLMTMPPFFDQPERVRPYFASLRGLRDRLVEKGVLAPEMTELSMGMTGDFEVAIEEGATIVRIGTALFGSRYAS